MAVLVQMVGLTGTEIDIWMVMLPAVAGLGFNSQRHIRWSHSWVCGQLSWPWLSDNNQRGVWWSRCQIVLLESYNDGLT